jgi:hypothetical protein
VVYVGTDKEDRSKVGTSVNLEERESNHKSSNVDYSTKYVIPCNDHMLIERIVKCILKKYTVNNSSEWFNISPDKLKVIVETVVFIIDDIPSESCDEIYNMMSQLSSYKNIIDPLKIVVNKKVNTTIKIEPQDKIINKFFDISVYENFIKNNCELNYKDNTRNLITEFKNSLQNTELKDKINVLFFEKDYTNYHGFLPKFRNEFFYNLEILLNTKLTHIKVKHYSDTGRVSLVHSKGLSGIRTKKKPFFDPDVYIDFFNNKLEKTNNMENRILTKTLLDTFMKYINDKKIKYIPTMIYSKNQKSGYGFIRHFKDELLNTFIKHFDLLREERLAISLNPRKSARGFHLIKAL